MNQIKMNPINAKKIIVEFEDEKWVFDDFELIETNFMGEKIYQLKGEPKIINKKNEEKEEDIKLVMESLNISKEEAIELLNKTDWEVAEAIALGEKKLNKD